MSRDCPNCAEPLTTSGKCTSCAYGRSMRGTSTGSQRTSEREDQRNRCCYLSNHVRCRWIGSATDAWGQGQLYCSRHWGAGRSDPVEGQRIVDDSVRTVPDNFDYSSEAIVRVTREAFRKSPIGEKRLDNNTAREFTRKFPHVSARIGLHQRRLDDPDVLEADAERDAIKATDGLAV